MVDRFPLGVEDPVLEGDEYARFHGLSSVLSVRRAAMNSAANRGKFHPSFTSFAAYEPRAGQFFTGLLVAAQLRHAVAVVKDVAEQLPQHRFAFHEQADVVLVRHADAAVHLDALANREIG